MGDLEQREKDLEQREKNLEQREKDLEIEELKRKKDLEELRRDYERDHRRNIFLERVFPFKNYPLPAILLKDPMKKDFTVSTSRSSTSAIKERTNAEQWNQLVASLPECSDEEKRTLASVCATLLHKESCYRKYRMVWQNTKQNKKRYEKKITHPMVFSLFDAV